MAHKFAETAFTSKVRALQSKAGSRISYAAMDQGEDYNYLISEREATFIAERDSFYMASVSETGWPYVQHRGGPLGFMKVIDANRIGFADYAGNRQYVSAGNFVSDNRVSLFFMDYPNRRRLKLLGRVEMVDGNDPEILAALSDQNYLAAVERGFVIHVEAFDWNCPQHITPRFTESQIRDEIMPARRDEIASETEAGKAAASYAEISNATPEITEVLEDTVIGNGPIELVITGMRQLTPRIRGFELRSPDGRELPYFTAGSHIRVPMRLANGRLVDREYSIASDPANRDHYEIAVLHEPDGRGGSRSVHDNFSLGMTLKVDSPTNLFPLHEDKRPTIFIAGGIGITPIRSMAYALKRADAEFQLHYAGRERRDMAFLNELERTYDNGIQVYASKDHQRLDIEATLAGMPEKSLVYICGPMRLIDDVVQAARKLGITADRIRFERFE